MKEIKRSKSEKAWLVWAPRRQRNTGKSRPDLIVELESLVEAAGGTVVGGQTNMLQVEHPATVIGKGVIEHLKATVEEKEIDVVVFQNLLRPKQQLNLETELGVKVLDRREVILDIFAQRARTREGKLQVELAQLSFKSGRLIGARKDLSRLGGGIGTRGPGEKKLEEDRRKIRKIMKQIEDELATVRRTRTLHYERRKEVGYPVVAIVGYTNAGKSTLFNRLTGAEVFVADQLFATLDPTARKLRLPSGREAILVDTVGFIHELPTELRQAFLATLEGIGEADLLVHVVDGSSEAADANVQSVDKILNELSFNDKPSILVLNKCDLGAVFPGDTDWPDAFAVSARSGAGIDTLLEAIERELSAQHAERPV
jgi:GTP-binding protein HflX